MLGNRLHIRIKINHFTGKKKGTRIVTNISLTLTDIQE